MIWPYKCLFLFLFTQKGEGRFACTMPCDRNVDLFFGELCPVTHIWCLTPLPWPTQLLKDVYDHVEEFVKAVVFHLHCLQITFCCLQLLWIARKDKMYGNWWLQATEGEEPGACTYITLYIALFKPKGFWIWMHTPLESTLNSLLY